MSTPIQQKMYNFIRQYIEENGYSPSLAEIAYGIGISSKSVSLISRNIHVMVASGRLKFDKKGYRNIQVVGTGLTLPLLGRIAAGKPIEAIENRQTIDLGVLLRGDDHFVLEVKGESMIDEGIYDGDLVICRHKKNPREGDIVVALIDDKEATLKRLSYKIDGRITLIPANSALKPTAYLPHRVHIQGVFVGLLRLKSS